MKKSVLFCLALLAALAGCAAPAEKEAKGQDKVIIALLDTGVSTAAIDPKNLLPGHNYVTGTNDTEDRINHGTAVSSVILGCESAGVEPMAPEDCFVVPLVVKDQVEGPKSAAPETLAQAIRDSIDEYGADIINLSLGIKTDVPALEKAIAYAEKKGVLVVSAVGNEGENAEFYYPAAYETVLAVGSHDRHREISDFSQKNGTADLLAPGEDVWLASKTGRTYGARGTSYATGYVSAAAAKLLSADPALSPAELRDILCRTAEDIGAPGRDFDSGWGILSLQAALTDLSQN